jgi:hypothetical protein
MRRAHPSIRVGAVQQVVSGMYRNPFASMLRGESVDAAPVCRQADTGLMFSARPQQFG